MSEQNPQTGGGGKKARKSKKRIILTVLIIVLAVVVVAVSAWFVVDTYVRDRNNSEQQALLTSGQDGEGDVTKILETYGSEYATAAPEINNSDPRQWNKATLDKAYLVLLYANKSGNFTQAQTTLFFIELAQRNGLDIDDNSWGVDAAQRSAIQQHAQDLSNKVRDGAGAQSE